MISRHPSLLQPDNSCLLIIDVQEKFRPHIHKFDDMTKNIIRLIKIANQLGVPIIVSEQYPQGLGETIKEIALELTDKAKVFTKKDFSCCQVETYVKHLEGLNRKQVLTTGIESHVCINQSVHDLLNLNYQVHLIEDAISSRHNFNKEIGIKKMLGSGALISSTEMAAFELMRNADQKDFKSIQNLFKENSPFKL